MRRDSYWKVPAPAPPAGILVAVVNAQMRTLFEQLGLPCKHKFSPHSDAHIVIADKANGASLDDSADGLDEDGVVDKIVATVLHASSGHVALTPAVQVGVCHSCGGSNAAAP